MLGAAVVLVWVPVTNPDSYRGAEGLTSMLAVGGCLAIWFLRAGGRRSRFQIAIALTCITLSLATLAFIFLDPLAAARLLWQVLPLVTIAIAWCLLWSPFRNGHVLDVSLLWVIFGLILDFFCIVTGYLIDSSVGSASILFSVAVAAPWVSLAFLILFFPTVKIKTWAAVPILTVALGWGVYVSGEALALAAASEIHAP